MKQSVSWRRRAVFGLTLVAAGFLVLSFLRYYRENLSELVLKMVLLPASLIAGGFLLGDEELWKRKEYWLLLSFFAWVYISAVCSEPYYGIFEQNWRFLWILATEILFLFPLGFYYASAGKAGDRILAGFAWISIIAAVVLCIWGLSCVIQGKYLEAVSINGYGVGIHPGERRLVVLAHPNPTGMVFTLCGILAVMMAHRSQHALVRVFLAVSVLLLYAGTCLTDSRTSEMAFAAGIGCSLFITLFSALRGKRRYLRWSISVIAGIIGVGVVFLLRTPVTAGLNGIAEQYAATHAAETAAPVQKESGNTGKATDSGQAEEMPEPVEVPTAVSRKIRIEPGKAFSGREKIWRTIIERMNQEKRSWLIGFSPYGIGLVMGEWMKEFIGYWMTELHNSMIQILASSGIPALLTLLAFLAVLGVKSIRAMTEDGEPEIPGWSRYAPAFFIAVICFSILETFFVLYEQVHFANFWFFLLAGWFCGGCSSEDRDPVRNPARTKITNFSKFNPNSSFFL